MLKRFNTLGNKVLGQSRKGLGYYLETMSSATNLRFVPYIKKEKYGFFVDDLSTNVREHFDLECASLSEILAVMGDLERNW
jgi:hypothetical protein